MSPITDVKEVRLAEMSPNSRESIVLQCYFNQKALESDQFVIQLTCRIGSESQTVTVETDAEFKSVSSAGFSLKDLTKKG